MAGTACDHITLHFARQGGSSLQIVELKDVLDCISSYQTQFQTPRRDYFQVFLYEREAGTHVKKV